jgi:hypothetical protein
MCVPMKMLDGNLLVWCRLAWFVKAGMVGYARGFSVVMYRVHVDAILSLGRRRSYFERDLAWCRHTCTRVSLHTLSCVCACQWPVCVEYASIGPSQ